MTVATAAAGREGQPHGRILIVDDDPGMRRMLSRVLAPTYQVEAAAGAAEALARLTAWRCDLALVDVRLSDGNGYQLCQAIRERRPETDVILITGSLSEPDEKLYRSLEEGAFYFLFKPFDRRVLLALVERCLRGQQERAAKERHARTLAADLDKARQFQRSLVPGGPVLAAGWRLEGRLLSCDALAGDLFLALAPAGGEGLVCAAADVVGHGVRAAMYAGMLHSTLDAARRRSAEPERLVRELLDGIDFFEDATYATLFYALLLPDGRLRYVNAGHPPALWQGGAGGRRIEQLPATGLFLSKLFRDRPPRVVEIALAPGDRLLLYTDGASEINDAGGRELGAEGLAETLAACRGLPAGAVLDALLARIREHGGGRPVADDVTLLLVERSGEAPGLPKEEA
ncbi:MAG TPA: SpoIIE family protein phosphatase [Thermoanaerobaculia bacterium]|nr:SpoIIE family protein phosphatase [Thermoanaerobaculia bacterium]